MCLPRPSRAASRSCCVAVVLLRYDALMISIRYSIGVAFVLLSISACSDDKAARSPESAVPSASTEEPTRCVTTPAPDGRLISVTIDDVVDGFGSLGLRADGGLTPGVVRVEVTGDAANASPLGVTILRDDIPVGAVFGVGAGETCGIDLEVSAGVYRITDGDRNVEFTVEG